MFSTKRLAQIDFFKENPIQVQRDTLVELLRRAADTEYGLKYDFDSILTAEQYRERLPLIHYEELARNPSRGLPNRQAQQRQKASLSRSAKNLWKAVISEAVRMLSLFSINYTRMHKYSTGRPWLWGEVAKYPRQTTIAATETCPPY